jgi:hypothetical protein
MAMKPSDKRAQVEEALRARLHEVPRDLSVPRYVRWDGLQPCPQDDYRVEYHGDAAQILSQVGSLDQTLYPLRKRLRIEPDLELSIVHIFLEPVGA